LLLFGVPHSLSRSRIWLDWAERIEILLSETILAPCGFFGFNRPDELGRFKDRCDDPSYIAASYPFVPVYGIVTSSSSLASSIVGSPRCVS